MREQVREKLAHDEHASRYGSGVRPRPRVAGEFELVGFSIGAFLLDAFGPVLLDEVSDAGYLVGGELQKAESVRLMKGYGGEASLDRGQSVVSGGFACHFGFDIRW